MALLFAFGCATCLKVARNIRDLLHPLFGSPLHFICCARCSIIHCFRTSVSSSTASTSSYTPINYTPPDEHIKAVDIRAPTTPLIYEQIDVARQFRLFQKEAKHMASRGPLRFEKHVQHLLGLSSIFLLKPGRIHSNMYDFIDRATCCKFRSKLLEDQGAGHSSLPQAMRTELERIISSMPNESTRLPASRAISNLMSDDSMTGVNRILLSVRNMVERLPEHCMNGGPLETELITRYLEATLTPLFEDLSNNVMFRWSSISDGKATSYEKPDAIITVVDVAPYSISELLVTGSQARGEDHHQPVVSYVGAFRTSNVNTLRGEVHRRRKQA